MSRIEAYKLDCAGCSNTVEIPAGDPNQSEQVTCPQCGAGLLIEWRYPRFKVRPNSGVTLGVHGLEPAEDALGHPVRVPEGMPHDIRTAFSAVDRAVGKKTCVQAQSFLGRT